MPLTGQPDLALIRPGRVHEVTGPGRHAFAAALAGRLAGPVLWLREGRERGMLCPQGLALFFDPARLVLARPTGARAILQVAEEALRSGAAPLVVAELDQAPDLTASRRLQLAAGAGAGEGSRNRSKGARGLCLLPRINTRPNAAETRWHCTPILGKTTGSLAEGRGHQLWDLVKNKRGKLGVWEVTWPAPIQETTQETAPARPRTRGRFRHAPACP